MVRKIVLCFSLIAMIVAILPRANSLYDLTGEEQLPGQLIGIVHWVNTALRPQVQLSAETTPTLANVSPFGMNAFPELEATLSVREEIFQQLNTAGFKFLRQNFTWESIEISEKGDFWDHKNNVDAWEKYDHIVELAQQYEVELIARLDNPPAWSRAAGNENGTAAPPDNYADYGDFVATIVERYKGRVTYFQLWNEPNGNDEWGFTGPNPEQFAELLCIGYQRAKAANPDAVILAPALTPTFAVNNANLNDLIFMQRMYNAGAGNCFDVMSAQGYGLRSGPTDQRLQWNRVNFPYHLFMRDLMVVNGDADKPIWISETGWNATPFDRFPDGSEQYGRVDLEQQARYAQQLYTRVQSEWPWIGTVNYWFLKRPAPEVEQQSYYFRAMDPDFEPLPAWDALEAVAQAETPQKKVIDVWEFRPKLFQLASFSFIITLIQIAQTPDDRKTA